MERLTYRGAYGRWTVHSRDKKGRLCTEQGPHVDRLATYEDTGLDPEEIKELCTDDMIGKFGKTVFLTREEAEHALKEEKHHDG